MGDPAHPNEVELFHGSTAEGVASIVNQGFDMRLSVSLRLPLRRAKLLPHSPRCGRPKPL
jgi:hypothetical protein